MPGLLDLFSGSSAQNQGLLAAAAQMLQASGPSRTPVGLGQILGGGLSAYTGGVDAAQQRQLQQDQARQMAMLTGLKIKDAESDLKNQDMLRERQRKIQEELLGIGAADAGTPQAAMPQPMASAAPGAGPLSPKVGGPDWLQAFQQQQPMPQQPAPGQPLQRGNLTATTANRLMREAEVYSKHGDFDAANKRYEAATKLMPEVSRIETASRDGKPVRVITFKDGTEQVSEFGAAPNMKEMNLGGTSQWVDENLVTNGQTFKRTQSPDSIASNAVSMRGQNMSAATAMRGQDLTNARDKDRIKAPTEFQGKSAAFGLRATESDKVLRQLEGQGVTNTGLIKSFAEGAGEMVPFIGDKVGAAVGSGMNTLPGVLGGPNAQQQQVEQARRDFVNAILRQESGAAIGPSEFHNASRQYFPQPGDTDTVIAQKARNRQLAIQGLQANAGRAALTAPAASNGWSITKVP